MYVGSWALVNPLVRATLAGSPAQLDAVLHAEGPAAPDWLSALRSAHDELRNTWGCSPTVLADLPQLLTKKVDKLQRACSDIIAEKLLAETPLACPFFF